MARDRSLKGLVGKEDTGRSEFAMESALSRRNQQRPLPGYGRQRREPGSHQVRHWLRSESGTIDLE